MTAAALPWIYDDGGRCDAGYSGPAGDCVVRACAIATGLPYAYVYDTLHDLQRHWLSTRRKPRVTRSGRPESASPRTGVFRDVFGPWLVDTLGWTWTPTMHIGSGTTVHLAVGELPTGRPLIANLSKHVAAVVPGDHPAVDDRRYGPGDMVVLDTGDPTREGTRCVYGYWSAP